MSRKKIEAFGNASIDDYFVTAFDTLFLDTMLRYPKINITNNELNKANWLTISMITIPPNNTYALSLDFIDVINMYPGFLPLSL